MKRIFSFMMALMASHVMWGQSTENPKVDLTLKEYYVKVDGVGDGSSWDNAIGAKDFAYVFNNFQTEGATFYMAAGTYHAVYNSKGEATNDDAACWESQHGANIYGGYDPKSTGNASTTKADPVTYRTIFSGDLNGDDEVVFDSECDDRFQNFTDNTKTSLLTMTVASDIHVSGIELTGMSFSRGTSPAMLRMSAAEGAKCNVTIDHCKLYVGDKGIETRNLNYLLIDQCEFDHILNSVASANRDMKISNSTITYSNGVYFDADNSELVIENSTFVKNTSDLTASDYTNESSSTVVKVYNNTFISCKSGAYFDIADNVTAYVVGNIFTGSKFYSRNTGYELRLKTFTNNLLACKLEEADYIEEKDNIKLENPIKLYRTIFDGTYSRPDSIFTPNLTYKGASTRTVALLKKELSDGTSLCFPRIENVTADQRGEFRPYSTCLGAYEIGCKIDTTIVADTIVVGSKYSIDGKVYDKIGLYEEIFTKHTSTRTGCDSIVSHRLFVVPDPSIKEYYVKKQGTGKEDGSDWDNAIGEKKFAYVFATLQTEGVTFYMAGGTYHPVYNHNSEETNDKYAFWSSRHGANIYGGYDPKATGNAKTTKADPSKYKTIFSGDLNEDDEVVMKDDCDYTFDKFNNNTVSLLSMNIAGDIHISGVEFTGMTFSRGTSPAMIQLSAKEGTSYKATIDYCKLYVGDKGIEVNNVSDLLVDQCEFDYILNAAAYSNRNMKVTNSTFTYTNGVNYNGDNTELVVENSTFVKNRSDIQAFDYSNESSSTIVKVYNNTFISCKDDANFVIGDNVTAFVEGNIFTNSDFFISKTGYELKTKTYTNNLIAGKFTESDIVSEKNNIRLENAIPLYESVFDGKYSKKDSVFTPNLTYKDAFTRTVALLDDTLADGTSLRFPRLENITEDQRGVSRFDNTCFGAYEIGCSSDTTFSTVTVVAGTKFENGKVYDKVGRYDYIVVSYDRSSSSCDSVVCYTLNVVPDTSIKEFYVKEQATGKGDGSNWDNAMGSNDFAFVFGNLLKEGVTFYMAAGTYHAVYDSDGKETNDKTAHWVSKHGANIYGGYNPKATGTASTTKANPILYKTIFTGDVNGDDKVAIKDDCEDILENFGDNMVSSMLVMDVASDVHISGIELKALSFARGTAPAMIQLNAKKETSYKATIDYCKLYASDKGLEVNNIGSLYIDQCEFEHLRNAAVFSNRNMYVTNSTFTYTNGVNYNGDNSELVVENSTFVKNRSDIQAYDYNNEKSSTTIKVNNNTFLSCREGSNFVLGDNVTASVVGNILAGAEIYISKTGYELKQQTFVNNVLACSKYTVGETYVEKDNIKLESATPLYNGVFEGAYSEVDNKFTPDLTYKGASTRTVALLKDNLPDGTSIRFPRLEKITVDQRGVSRSDMTCMGAYEKEKETGVNDVKDAVCEVYPNPVKDVLNVSGCGESFSYEIIDLTGRTVSRGKSVGTIGVSELSNGVYLLKLQSAGQQACLRFVKQ